MLGNLTGLHLLIILGIVVLLFGATRLPALARGLGQSISIFKREMQHDDKPAATPADTAVAQNAAAEPVVNPAATVQPNVETKP
ncbi:twin-arginine translocase TatA/TatE family subunit [Curtobacterium ammoniigenes]|uniref:twin-arginine translocase TatA/TatE family subunit n=1 Tax=Curtobacterium ammoniigenes TaxID=395387 RepID=UPI00082A4BF8|nr:twin-arginine translocase TatA/TatE family subunit [Curtobacterium ammoniigenes]